MWACQILRLSYRRLIYDLAILSTAYSVRSVVGMNDQRSPYLAPSNFNILRYTTWACGLPVKLWLTGLCVCLRRGSGHWASIQTFQERILKKCQFGWFRNMRISGDFRLTCQGNLCPLQLKCQARDFPSRRACFHCVETKNTLYYENSHWLPLHGQRKQTIFCHTEPHLFLILSLVSLYLTFFNNITCTCAQRKAQR